MYWQVHIVQVDSRVMRGEERMRFRGTVVVNGGALGGVGEWTRGGQVDAL